MLRTVSSYIYRKHVLPKRLAEVKAGVQPLECEEALGYFPLQPTEVPNIPPQVLEKFVLLNRNRIELDGPRTDRRLAIVVPYRDREEHLKYLVPWIQERLEQEGIEHKIVVVNQADQHLFNIGALRNIGFQYLEHWADYVCVHDVDHLPRRVSYAYTGHPTGLVWRGYPYGYLSGVVMFPKEVFRRIRGYSNAYWHWGWEDCDLRDRLLVSGYTPIYYSQECFARQDHAPSKACSPDGKHHRWGIRKRRLHRQSRRNRLQYLERSQGQTLAEQDGLDSLDYDLLDVREMSTHTVLDVSLTRMAKRHRVPVI